MSTLATAATKNVKAIHGADLWNLENPYWRDEGIELQPSTIPGAALGVFATRAFQKHEIVCVYDGVVRQSLTDADDRNDYIAYIPAFASPTRVAMYIDAADPASCKHLGRYVNHQCYTRSNVEWYNAKPSSADAPQVVFFRARRFIYPGEELFVDYGPDYWRGRAFMKRTAPKFVRPKM